MENTDLYKLKEEFLKKWSRERMKKLTLEEYANDTKDSFIYDMEFGFVKELGGMGGGSAFKFGIYRMKDTKKDKKSGQIWDGKYAWYEKYGNTRDKAFENVKQNIISLIDAVDNDNLELIDDIDFGDNYKWKLAFLYSDFKVLNIFKRESFNDILSILDINEEHKSYSRSNRLIVEKLEGDYFNYTSRLWKFYEMNEVIRLIKNNNTVNKFFKAVNYLCNEFDLDNENENIYASALVNKKRLHFTVGSRYIIRVGLKNNKSIIGFHILKSYRNEIFSKYNSEIVSEEKSGDKDYIWVDINADGLNIPDVFPFLRKLTDNNLEGQSKSQFRSMYANKHNDWIVETAINKDLQIKILGKITEKIIEKKSRMNKNNALNQILFGPPGTGKTYKTINKAIQIVDPEFYQNNHTNRDELKRRFNELLITDFDTMDGRIVFTTFHQSMSYEDFVEGIKPEVVNENITYNVSDGIFKKICEIAGYKHSVETEKPASILNWNNKQYNDSNFYKMSLGNTEDSDESDIYSYCIKNNCISLGYDGTSDFSGLNRENIYKQVKENGGEKFAPDALNRLINKMSIGDYVIISNGNLYARAIGKITSDYYFDDNTEIEHNHFRNVEWILTDKNIHVSEFLNKRFSQQSIYHIDKSYLKEEYFKSKDKLSSNDKKSYALIIDEINRGNVSSIFGELITLIEEDKRKGNKEELSITLPYSKIPFSVPNNLHIIGTMNTADRSVEALDTALRRRFEFEEMLPKPELLEKIKCEGGIELHKMLFAINKRIEKLIDKDNQIGHSYFMNSENKLSLDQLQNIFKNKVIPLLQEYFYGDFAKIGLVLGESFIKKEDDNVVFTDFDYEDKELLDERIVYKFSDIDKLGVEHFNSIYK